MKLKTHYQILGINTTATNDEIKTAFRKLAKLYHPDKNPNTKEMFEHILLAYEVLIDKTRRSQYDIKLKYKSSVSEANKSSATRKDFKYSDEELKRRQYFRENYKKEFDASQKRGSGTPAKKIYNEHKYILFAAPVAVALFLFVIKDFSKPTDKTRNNTKTQINNKKNSELKMGDVPYASYFNNAVFDTINAKVLKIKNPGEKDAIICLFNKAGKFLRSCFLQSGFFVELSQLPVSEIEIRIFFGKQWNSEKTSQGIAAFGRFEKEEDYRKLKYVIKKETGELILDQDKIQEAESISEKKFFERPEAD